VRPHGEESVPDTPGPPLPPAQSSRLRQEAAADSATVHSQSIPPAAPDSLPEPDRKRWRRHYAAAPLDACPDLSSGLLYSQAPSSPFLSARLYSTVSDSFSFLPYFPLSPEF